MIDHLHAKISADIAADLFDQFLALTHPYLDEPDGGDIVNGTMIALGTYFFFTMTKGMTPEEREGFIDFLFLNIEETVNNLLADPPAWLKQTEED